MENKFKISAEKFAEIQDIWRVKITTIEDFNAAISKTNEKGVYIQNYLESYHPVLAAVPTMPVASMRRAHLPWWLQRDIFREVVELYVEPTAVVRAMRTQGQLTLAFPHISKEDPTQVAYIADRAGAIEDRKVRTTLGRLLRKMYPIMKDDEVQMLEAEHRAELDGTFLVANTIEEIERVYLGSGGNSCMRHERSEWELEDYHPASVYASPGMGVAYLEAEGKVTARSVIWQNPDKPDDKRYVRVYGDSALAKRLTRSGYRIAGLKGAKLIALQDSSFGHREGYDDNGRPIKRFVMPYLDPAGGRDSSTREIERAVLCIKFKGEDFIRLVGKEDEVRYRQIFNVGEASPQTTSGYVELVEADLADAEIVSPFDGSVINILDLSSTAKYWVYVNGEFKEVFSSLMSAYNFSQVEASKCYTKQLWAHVSPTEDSKYVWVTGEDYDRYQVQDMYFNSPETLKKYGLAKLSPKWYDESGYRMGLSEYYDVEVAVQDGEEVLRLTLSEYGIKESDVIKLHTLDDVINIHKDTVKFFRKHGYKSLGKLAGYIRWVHPQHPQLVTSVKGRLLHRDLQDVVSVPGGWATERESWQGAFYHALYTVKNTDEYSTVLGLTEGWKEEVQRGFRRISNVRECKYLLSRIGTSPMRMDGRMFYPLKLDSEGQVVFNRYNSTPQDPRDIFAAVEHPGVEALLLEDCDASSQALWPFYKEAILFIKEVYQKRMAEIQEENTKARHEACSLEASELLLLCVNETLSLGAGTDLQVQGQIRWHYDTAPDRDERDAGYLRLFFADPEQAWKVADDLVRVAMRNFVVRCPILRESHITYSSWRSHPEGFSDLSLRFEPYSMTRDEFECTEVASEPLPGIAGELDATYIQQMLAEATPQADTATFVEDQLVEIVPF